MKFFNSLWFKCIACLLLIAIVSGALLSVLSDVWYVSSEERTSRAIKKIYGEIVDYSIVLDTDRKIDGSDEYFSVIEYDGMGKIDKIYDIGGNLLFFSTGYKGYKNGTVSIWVNAKMTDSGYAIDKIVLGGSEKQTLMSKLTADYYNGFITEDVEILYLEDKYFSAKAGEVNANPVSGATYSATAGANAVNCVIKYIGEKNKQGGDK